MDIVFAVIGFAQAAVVALIAGLFARDSRNKKKVTDATEARASLRAEESRLSMKLMSADISLSLATARAVRDGKTNGIMSDAIERAEAAEQEYYDFVKATAAKQITG